MPDLLRATFVARPNRFIVQAYLAGTGNVTAHLADPGRLRELLVPGALLRLREAPPGSQRRTRYSVVLARAASPSRAWVSVETTRANELAADLLHDGSVPGLRRAISVRREVRHGSSRFDFVVTTRDGKPTWVEVKSVTLVEGQTALFPDAPTARGRRHVRELTEMVRSGERAMVLLLLQRGDADRIVPHRGIDPEFADALTEARRVGVLLRGARFRISSSGKASFLGMVPVHTRRSK